MRLIVASVATATAMAVGSAVPAMAANKALVLSGIGGAAMPDFMMAEVLGGILGGYDREAVVWPQRSDRPLINLKSVTLGEAVDVGADNLHAAINRALAEIGPGEHVTVVGLSAGALVVDEELRRLAADPDAPDESRLNFVVVGDSSRFSFNENRYDPILDYTYTAPADTKYDTTVVTAQYDGFADYPDRQWNILAIANAIVGEMLLHVPSMFADLSKTPADSITVNTNSLGGVTTDYFLQPETLPLVQVMPLLVLGEPALKKMIDAAYVRHDDTSAAAGVPAPADTETNPPGDDTDTPQTTDDQTTDDQTTDAEAETTGVVESDEPTEDEPDDTESATAGKAAEEKSTGSDSGTDAVPKRKRPRAATRGSVAGERLGVTRIVSARPTATARTDGQSPPPG